MTKQPQYDDRDIEWWKHVCSRLALALALVIMISGGIGIWLESENRSLKAFKKNNQILRESNNKVTEKLKIQTQENDENQIEIKQLEKELFDLKVENATLKALLEAEK